LRRKTFDSLMSMAGLVMVAVLAGAGLLLNAYAIGTLAGIGSLIALLAAAALLLLSGLGLCHARRTSPDEEILSGSGAATNGHSARRPATASTVLESLGARFSYLPGLRGAPAWVPIPVRRPVWEDWDGIEGSVR